MNTLRNRVSTTDTVHSEMWCGEVVMVELHKSHPVAKGHKDIDKAQEINYYTSGWSTTHSKW